MRERSILALMNRHHVDVQQAQRVADTAQAFLAQASDGWGLTDTMAAGVLRWGALLHELGLSVSHSQFHKHGAYLVQNSDLPGFSRQEQQAVAVLVRAHRRKVPLSAFEELPGDDQPILLRLSLLLRLSARLHHARSDQPLPDIRIRVAAKKLVMSFPEGWLADHPLTRADMEQEQEFFEGGGFELVIT